MQFFAMRDYAKKRSWTVAVEVKDVGAWRTHTRIAGEAHRGCPTAGDRFLSWSGDWIAGGGRWWIW